MKNILPRVAHLYPVLIDTNRINIEGFCLCVSFVGFTWAKLRFGMYLWQFKYLFCFFFSKPSYAFWFLPPQISTIHSFLQGE